MEAETSTGIQLIIVGRNKASKRVARGGVSGEFRTRLPETPILAAARTGLFRPTVLT
jgi:hypothetical protein